MGHPGTPLGATVVGLDNTSTPRLGLISRLPVGTILVKIDSFSIHLAIAYSRGIAILERDRNTG